MAANARDLHCLLLKTDDSVATGKHVGVRGYLLCDAGHSQRWVLPREAAAWLSLANGDEEGAETLMRSAAELEDQTDKSGLSPGRVLPAHEQLADMLMEVGRPQEALAEYQTSLTHATRRYNSFIGAARAAVAAEQNDVARSYYEKLLQLAASDSARVELDEAREFLDVAL